MPREEVMKWSLRPGECVVEVMIRAWVNSDWNLGDFLSKTILL